MNILIVDNSIGITGALKAIIETIEGLRNEHQFSFLVPKGSETVAYLKQFGYSAHEMDFIEISRNQGKNLLYPFRLLANGFRLAKICRTQHIDVIQVNDVYNLVAVASRIFRKTTLITHVRRMPESFPGVLYRMWVKIQYRFSQVILPVSEANARSFHNPKKVQVLYDPAMMDQQKVNYTASDQGEIKILYLANYTRGKGQNHAIEALRILNEKHEQGLKLHLKFVGSDFNLKVNQEFKAELQALASSYQLQECIEFASETTQIFKEIEQTDLMLNFSDSESLSRVTMEALYYGIPIIATDVGGTREMITHNVNGMLVEKANTAQMAASLLELASSAEKRMLFNRNNEGFIREKFSPERISKQLNKIYTDLKNNTFD